MIKALIEASSKTDAPLVEEVVKTLDKLGVQSSLWIASAYRVNPRYFEPYYRVAVLTGFKKARMMEDAAEHAHLIKRAVRPLFVVGPRVLNRSLDNKPLIEYIIDIVKTVNIPVCATAHTNRKLVELGMTPESSYDIVEIVNSLKDRDWKGVRKEGNHDLVVFLGVRCDLAEQGLSTLKHFAPHLKTMTLCQNFHPNADYSFPNLKDDTWTGFLRNLIGKLTETEA